MTSKKGNKNNAKVLDEDLSDLINESQFVKDSPSSKKIQKRHRNDTSEEEGFAKLIGQYQTNLKKKKLQVVEACKESCQKILDVKNNQLETRKERTDNMLKKISEVMTQLEADCNVMKENHKKLENLMGAIAKCLQQATTAHKQNLKALQDSYSLFKKHVEGLLTKGAMRADDRPLWFDVYRAFPPVAEPKFAKPKPEIKPIRQILYPEDGIRVKFHSSGHGLGAISMISQTETQTKRLVQQYEKLKSQGVPEDELIEKSAAAVGIERQLEAAKATTHPDSVTAKVRAEINVQNIFSEK